jgi:rhomboid protease GluP
MIPLLSTLLSITMRRMENQEQPQPPQQKVVIRLNRATPVLTYGLLVVLALIFAYATSLDDTGTVARFTDGTPITERELFLLDWAKINELVFDGEFYRLFTSMFVHLEATHFFFNAYALYLFGREVESIYGHLRFAIIYILGGLAGSVASLLYTDGLSIGASGAIFAVFAASGVYFYHHQRLFGEGARQRLVQMGVLALINIVFGITVPRIDNAAHVGGMLGGFILAWFMSPEHQIRGLEAGNPHIIDTNTTRDWLVVPVVFSMALAIIVIMFSSTA